MQDSVLIIPVRHAPENKKGSESLPFSVGFYQPFFSFELSWCFFLSSTILTNHSTMFGMLVFPMRAPASRANA